MWLPENTNRILLWGVAREPFWVPRLSGVGMKFLFKSLKVSLENEYVKFVTSFSSELCRC